MRIVTITLYVPDEMEDKATAIFARLQDEKRAKGYLPATGTAPAPAVLPGTLPKPSGNAKKQPVLTSAASGLPATPPQPSERPIPSFEPELLTPIEANQAVQFIASDRYWMQRKYDGVRRGIVRTPSGLFGFNKLGQLKPFAGEIGAELMTLPFDDYEIDGEELGGGKLVLFDIFRFDGHDIREQPYFMRYDILRDAFGQTQKHVEVAPIWIGREDKMKAVESEFAGNGEGVVFKKLDAPYLPGRNGQHYKFKFYSTATFRVGVKSAKDAAKGHNSIVLELCIPANAGIRKAVWKQVGHASMNGKGRVPQPGEYVEIRYLYAVRTDDNRRGDFEVGIVQANYLSTRNDVTDADCSFDQLRYRKAPGK